jgi:hypothetical protein
VAHLDLDIHNAGAKHLARQAGVTARERASFSQRLATGFQDALRYFYPGVCVGWGGPCLLGCAVLCCAVLCCDVSDLLPAF